MYEDAPEHKDHVWSYAFVMDLTEDGRRLKRMPVVDEYTRGVPEHRCRVLDHRRRCRGHSHSAVSQQG